MPGYVIRIILLMSTIILVSFLYELDFSRKAIEVTGEIVSITSKAKGKKIVVSFIDENRERQILSFSIGPVIDLIKTYEVGAEVPIKYCRGCYFPEKIADTPNLYSLTLMMLILSCLVSFVLMFFWLKGKT